MLCRRLLAFRILLLLLLVAGCGDCGARKAATGDAPGKASAPASTPEPAGKKSSEQTPQAGLVASPTPVRPQEVLAPAPTIFRALQLAKILDFTKLPAPE